MSGTRGSTRAGAVTLVLGAGTGLAMLVGAARLAANSASAPQDLADVGLEGAAAPAMHDALCWFTTAVIDASGAVGSPTPARSAPRAASSPGAHDTPPEIVSAGEPLEVRGLCGDLNVDGAVDESDYDLFLAAFGHCAGQAGFDALADLDADTCITLVDYQAWLVCYNAANGVAPAAAPATPESLAVTPARTP